MSRNAKGWLQLGVPVVAMLVAFAFVLSLFLGAQQTDVERDTPVWTPEPTVATTTVAPTPSPTPEPTPALGCSEDFSPITPTKFTIERMGVDSPVMSLGWDPKTGAAASPPDKDAYVVGWLNEGPKPGSDKGNIVLTIHTYHVGRALGNDLYDPSSGLKPGDIIKMTDASGKTVCYRYREALKVWLSEYEKAPSNVLYDDHGRPQIAIIICWDWDWSKRASQSRIIFYADPVR